jgi:hypothetical protein
VPSIGQELARTRTARWYRSARGARRAGAWDERERCFTALSAVLSEAAARGAVTPGAGPAGTSWQPIRLPGILTMVARGAHFASAEPVYKRWRARQDGQPVPRWAGADPAIRPAAAFVAEAKIVAFWPYREGAVAGADAPGTTLPELALAYLEALASWAGEHRLLAACHPVGPPPCVTEDMAVLGGRLAARGARARSGRLAAIAAEVVAAAAADPGITPAAAAAAAAAEVRSLLAEPAALVADRVRDGAAELAERIAAGDAIGAAQAAALADALRRLDATLKARTVPGKGQRALRPAGREALRA